MGCSKSLITPQMALLYKDPDGESVFENSHAASSLEGKVGSMLTAFKGDFNLDSKIASLQEMLKEKDDTIARLEREIETMKVYIYVHI